MADKPIGKVVHYYDRIGVAVISLENDQLSVGDRVKIVTSEGEFEQTVASMEINKEQIQIAKPGDDFALKVDQPVREGNQIFKL